MNDKSNLCPLCGKETVPDAAFCPECGTAVGPQQPSGLGEAQTEAFSCSEQQPSAPDGPRFCDSGKPSPASPEKPQTEDGAKSKPVKPSQQLNDEGAESEPVRLSKQQNDGGAESEPVRPGKQQNDGSACTSILSSDTGSRTVTSILDYDDADRAELSAANGSGSRITAPLRPANCPECGAPVNDGMSFCDTCGFQLSASLPHTSVCPSCGTSASADMAFCSACGANLRNYQPGSPAPAASYAHSVPSSPPAVNGWSRPASAVQPTHQAVSYPQYTNPLPPGQPDFIQYPPAVQPQESIPSAISGQQQPLKYKDKWTALLLCFFLGHCGAHKFYEDKPKIGAFYLIAFWGLGIFTLFLSSALICLLCLIDFCVLLFKPTNYTP